MSFILRNKKIPVHSNGTSKNFEVKKNRRFLDGDPIIFQGILMDICMNNVKIGCLQKQTHQGPSTPHYLNKGNIIKIDAIVSQCILWRCFFCMCFCLLCLCLQEKL